MPMRTECKNYEKPSDLGTHYLKFLAQCYVALEARAAYCEHFFWISWSPHNVNSWNQLTTAEYVRDAVIQHWQRIFDVGSEEDARKAVNEETCKAVAERNTASDKATHGHMATTRKGT